MVFMVSDAGGPAPGRNISLAEATQDVDQRVGSRDNILIILLVVFLLGGFSGRFGGYGYGFGNRGIGGIGIVLIVLVVLVLTNRL